MSSDKFIVGRYINMIDPPIQKPAFNNGDFTTQQPMSLTVHESTGVFTKTSDIAQGAQAKVHRNFQWLAYFPGAINQVPLSGLDVLTGPMSGCWVMVYRINGVVHVGHVGTNLDDATQTAAVKQSWNAFAAANTADLIGGFNPLRHYPGDFPKAKESEQKPLVFAYVTAAYDLVAIVTYQQGGNTQQLRIAGRTTIASAPKTNLQKI